MGPSLLFSLRSRLIALVVLVAMPGFLLTLFVANAQRQAALEVIQTQNSGTLRLVAQGQAQMIATTRTLLTSMAGSPGVLQRDPSACAAMLTTVLNASTGFRGFRVTDRSGITWCRAPALSQPDEPIQSRFFSRAVGAGEFAIGEFETDPNTGLSQLAFGLPVRDAKGEIQQVISAGVSTDWLNALVRTLDLPQGYVVDVLDRTGTFIVRWPAPETYAGRSFPDSAITQQILRDARDGAEHVVQTKGVDGVSRLNAFERVPGLTDNDLFVNVGIAPEQTYAVVDASLLKGSVALAVSTFLAIAAAVWLAERAVIRPVSGIADAARQISRGNYDVRSNAAGGYDEISVLARDFNAMAGDLSRRNNAEILINRDLEHRVLARTTQLEASAAHLRESREQLRLLTQRQREVLEAEQTRLSREVHDQIGQALTGLKMDLSMLRKHLTAAIAPIPVTVAEKITSMGSLIDEAIDITRAIARTLRPSVLDDLGLGAALEWQARDFEKRNGAACAFINHNVNGELAPLVATAAFRIVQEALSNVTRHSHATEVLIEIEIVRDYLSVLVRDNGMGGAAEVFGAAQSLGFLGMLERARALHGTVEVHNAATSGTILTARLPLASVTSAPVART